MKKVLMYSGSPCPYCDHAKALLKSKNVPFEEIDVWKNKDKAKEMLKRTNVAEPPADRTFAFVLVCASVTQLDFVSTLKVFAILS